MRPLTPKHLFRHLEADRLKRAERLEQHVTRALQALRDEGLIRTVPSAPAPAPPRSTPPRPA
jgi:hypothetical protein